MRNLYLLLLLPFLALLLTGCTIDVQHHYDPQTITVNHHHDDQNLNLRRPHRAGDEK